MEETGGEAAPSGMIKFERNVRGGLHSHTREYREGSAAALTFGFPEEPVQRDLDSYMTVVYDSHYQSTLDVVCICSAMVGVPHRRLLPSYM